VKLGYMSKWLHHSGGTVCEPTDVPVNKRHLDMLRAYDAVGQTLHGLGDRTRARRDSVEMCEILFGKEFVARTR
jgi:trimethylamine--corrinoid protein Co-methyltransferase